MSSESPQRSVYILRARPPRGISPLAGIDGPSTLDELLRQVPTSNISGVLPRKLLPPGESVVFETRPSLFKLYGGRIVFIGLWSLLWIGFGVAAPGAFWGGVFLSFPFWLWLLVLVLQWRSQVFALTDRRIIKLSGITGSVFQDAAFSQIQNLSNDSGGIKFDTTPPVSSVYAASIPRRSIHWNAVPDLPQVYNFLQLAFAFFLRRLEDRAKVDALIGKVSSTSIECPYCGGLIDLTTLSSTKPRCPRCYAPIVLPR